MTYQHLNARERMSLFYRHKTGLSLREIGRRMNRSHTTISLELRRNKRIHGCYCDWAAQSMADARKALLRHTKRADNLKLRQYVTDKLQIDWSPEIISR